MVDSMEDHVVPIDDGLMVDVLIVEASVDESFTEEVWVVDVCLVELVEEDEGTVVEEDCVVGIFAVEVDTFVVLYKMKGPVNIDSKRSPIIIFLPFGRRRCGTTGDK